MTREKMNRRVTLLSACILLLACPHIQAQDDSHTTITPCTEVPLNGTRNMIFSSSFQLAWKMLEKDILKSEVRVKKDLPLVTLLNNSDPAVISSGHSVNLAGFVGKGIEKEINDQLREKFNREVDLSPYTEDPCNIICYAAFRKIIQFNTPFETFSQPFPFYSGGSVSDAACFGVWSAGTSEQHKRIREMVRVIDPNNNGDFIIRISNPGDEDEIILAQCPPENTFQETIEAVSRRIKESEPFPLADNDRLVIPKVVIHADTNYQELYGVHLTNPGFERYFFAEATQAISFELNESGALADSEAKIVLKKGPGPQTLIINHPFLIMMREKSAEKPYFAAWIANPDLLVKTD